jgi:hypothetical protein
MTTEDRWRVADVAHGKVDTAFRKFGDELGRNGARFILRLNDDPKFRRALARYAVEQLDGDKPAKVQAPKPSPLVHGLFVPTEVQVENVRKWNKKFALGITDEQFAALPVAPQWPDDKLVAVVLTFYPQQQEKMTPVQSMFETYWKLLEFRHKNSWRWDQIKTGEANLRFLDSCTVPGGTLRWETIDFGAHWNKVDGMKPQDVVGKGSATFGVLAAAAHHKKWVQSFDGTNVPYPTIGGLQLTVPGSAAWTILPYLRWDRGDRQFRLSARCASNQDGNWSVPSFRE